MDDTAKLLLILVLREKSKELEKKEGKYLSSLGKFSDIYIQGVQVRRNQLQERIEAIEKEYDI